MPPQASASTRPQRMSHPEQRDHAKETRSSKSPRSVAAPTLADRDVVRGQGGRDQRVEEASRIACGTRGPRSSRRSRCSSPTSRGARVPRTMRSCSRRRSCGRGCRQRADADTDRHQIKERLEQPVDQDGPRIATPQYPPMPDDDLPGGRDHQQVSHRAASGRCTAPRRCQGWSPQADIRRLQRSAPRLPCRGSGSGTGRRRATAGWRRRRAKDERQLGDGKNVPENR